MISERIPDRKLKNFRRKEQLNYGFSQHSSLLRCTRGDRCSIDLFRNFKANVYRQVDVEEVSQDQHIEQREEKSMRNSGNMRVNCNRPNIEIEPLDTQTQEGNPRRFLTNRYIDLSLPLSPHSMDGGLISRDVSDAHKLQ